MYACIIIINTHHFVVWFAWYGLKFLYFPCTDVNADNVLYMLTKYKFNPASWGKLAMGLRLRSAPKQIERVYKGEEAQLAALINHWVANESTSPGRSW